ncbi:MAG TPA: hypothetical protein VD997_00150 [Phycisphaerales bacterium]|nr:hypothetical protein [Phycisphaerales bacterium]
MKKYIARLMALACLVGAACVLPACNTTRGFGDDVDSLGENIEDAAEDNGARD